MASHIDRKVMNFAQWIIDCAGKYGNDSVVENVTALVEKHLGDAEKRMLFVRMILPSVVNNEQIPAGTLIDKTRDWFNHCSSEEVEKEATDMIKEYIVKVDKFRSLLGDLVATDEGAGKIEMVSKDLIKFGGYMELFLGK